MFDLKRPCVNCPARTDVAPYISPESLAAIVQAPAFQCHKTAEYVDGVATAGDRPQQCAGMMLVLTRSGRPNEIMQVGQRLGVFDPDSLDESAPVYPNLWTAIVAHGGEPDKLLPSWMARRREE